MRATEVEIVQRIARLDPNFGEIALEATRDGASADVQHERVRAAATPRQKLDDKDVDRETNLQHHSDTCQLGGPNTCKS